MDNGWAHHLARWVHAKQLGHQSWLIAGPRFVKNTGQMGFGSALRDAKETGDLTKRVALNHQLSDPLLGG